MKKILFLTTFFIFVSFLNPALANCGKDKANCKDEAIRIDKVGKNLYEVFQEDVKLFSPYDVDFDSTKKMLYALIDSETKTPPTSPGVEREQIYLKADLKRAIGIAHTTGMLNEFEYNNRYKKMTLIRKSGRLFYEIKGKKTGKILGIWPVSFNVKAEIGEDGRLASFEKPVILKILKYFIK